MVGIGDKKDSCPKGTDIPVGRERDNNHVKNKIVWGTDRYSREDKYGDVKSDYWGLDVLLLLGSSDYFSEEVEGDLSWDLSGEKMMAMQVWGKNSEQKGLGSA